MNPVIMVHEDVFDEKKNPFKHRFFSFLRELEAEVNMSIIVVGENLSTAEGEHSFRKKQQYFSILNRVFFENDFRLRKSFVKHFATALDIDFSNVAAVTLGKRKLKNNFVVTDKLQKELIKFYKIRTAHKECRACHSTGTIVEYDAYGCDDGKYKCNSCKGKGKIDFYTRGEI